MPSVYAEPTIAELLQAFEDGIRAQRDRYVDAREGSIYQHFGGVAAILWSRNARRDTDLWRAIYLDSAESTNLTALLNDRYDFERVEDSYGTGTARLTRSSVAAGAGTIWKGTRIVLFGPQTEPKRYVVTANKDVGSTETSAVVSIRAEQVGPGTQILIENSAGGGMRVDDPLWDTTWLVTRVQCDDGTSFEQASAARARFRELRRASRAGFVEAIVQACKDAGAVNALLFPSDYVGPNDDHGLNMAYVGDASFVGSDALVRAITVRLEDYRVLGDQLQVRPLGVAALPISARVYLWDSPARVSLDDVTKRTTGAILGYFDGASGFSYNRDALAGAILRASPEVQYVEFDLPSSDADVVSTVDGILNFPATLNRYRVTANDITLSILPPI